MAWPPPVLSTSRTNATPQVDLHAQDHNAVNLAVNDIVSRMTTVVTTYQELTGGATGPIIANSSYTPFSPTVAAVGWARVIVVEFQYYLSVAPGGTAEVALEHAGTNTKLSTASRPAGNGSVAGSYTVPVVANQTFPMRLIIRTTGADTSVFADTFSNRLSITGHPV